MWIGLAWIALLLIGGDVGCQFEVRALDADGNVLDPAGIYCEWLDDPGYWRGREGKNEDPYARSPWSAPQLEQADSGAARFAVLPGEEYRYGYLSPTGTSQERIRIPAQSIEVARDLRVTRRSPARLVLESAAGLPAPRSVRLFPSRTTTPLQHWGGEDFRDESGAGGPQRVELEVLSGDYVALVVYGQGRCEGGTGVPPDSRVRWGLLPVTVPPDGEAILMLPSYRGGTLELTFDVPDRSAYEAEQEALRAATPAPQTVLDSLMLRARPPSGLRVEERSFVHEFQSRGCLSFWDFESRHVFAPRPGHPALVWERFLPGELLLRIDAPGYASVEASVTIVEGETAHLSVELRRE